MKDISLIEAIKERKSVKLFDEAVKIPQEEMEEMIKLTCKAPSSVNLQPWRFVIVESPEAKDSIKALVRFNTRQLETSSAMILVLADNQHMNYADAIFQKNVDEGHMPQEVMEQNLGALKGLLAQAPEEMLKIQGLMDANLAAMQLMLAAKAYGYDTNPIGGFERAEVMEALNINQARYTPVMFIAIGRGIKEPHGSSRFEVSEVMAYNHGSEDGIIGIK